MWRMIFDIDNFNIWYIVEGYREIAWIINLRKLRCCIASCHFFFLSYSILMMKLIFIPCFPMIFVFEHYQLKLLEIVLASEDSEVGVVHAWSFQSWTESKVFCHNVSMSILQFRSIVQTAHAAMKIKIQGNLFLRSFRCIEQLLIILISDLKFTERLALSVRLLLIRLS